MNSLSKRAIPWYLTFLFSKTSFPSLASSFFLPHRNILYRHFHIVMLHNARICFQRITGIDMHQNASFCNFQNSINLLLYQYWHILFIEDLDFSPWSFIRKLNKTLMNINHMKPFFICCTSFYFFSWHSNQPSVIRRECQDD